LVIGRVERGCVAAVAGDFAEARKQRHHRLWNDEERLAMPAGWGESLKHASVVSAARILVIEDNGSDVFLLDRALKKQDLRFELIHLPSGAEALAFIRRHGAYADAPIPSLILVDLNLSKYTGEDILREIRSARHLGGVPVCVWSSSRSRRDEALLKDLGVSQFITKPSGLEQFMEIGKIVKGLIAAA
jgi:chemotaxis family two-component system response regulator Rcp1